MRGELAAFLGRFAVPAAVFFALAWAGAAQAGNYDIGSLASQFLQSKTQMTILSHDDEAAPECHQRHFVKVDPVVLPIVRNNGSVLERKWQEQWTLERCGTNVSYYVFFTEVGKGGAYYSIVDPERTEPLQQAKSKP